MKETKGVPGEYIPIPRRQGVARRIADREYPFKCCVVCGVQLPACLTIAHLDQDPGNNDPDNLALMCQAHHWMYDCGLYPVEAIKLLRAHWQVTNGVATHKARMKDAGRKAAATRKKSRSARKAWTTRRAQTP